VAPHDIIMYGTTSGV